MSKAWLGETLTVDTEGNLGVSSAAQLHNEVRLDLRKNDIVKEGRTIRRDVLTPMTRLQFDPDASVPFFQCQLDSPRDLRELADVLNVAAHNLRMNIPTRWAHDALSILIAEQDERVLKDQAISEGKNK